MIKFFRKIRQSLLSEGKNGKYFKYAIGEIVLVVIGILIAVGINSRYNDAQNDAKIKTILLQVQQELITDLIDAKRICNVFIQKDSLSRRIMHDSVTVALYKENFGNVVINRNYVSFSNKKGGYQRLLNNLENLPEHYKCLLPNFNSLYVELQNDVDDYNWRIKNTVYNAIDKGHESNSKITDYELGKHPEEAAEYFVNDPFLKNKTSKFINDLGNISSTANDWRIESILLYKKIDSLLGKVDRKYPDLLSPIPKKEILVSYLGEYQGIGGSYLNLDAPNFSINIDGDHLIVFLSELNNFKLFWQDDLYFFKKESRDIFKFYKNEKGQHSLEISDGYNNTILINKNDL